MSGRLSFSDALGVLSNRQYLLYTIGNFLSLTGDWAQRLAVGWLAWQLTGSPAWLGIILFCDTAPTLLISPIGGAIVDRMDRLRLTRVTVAFSALQPVFLAAMYFAGLLNIWWLLAATIYLGIINAFGQTARLALIALLVPERDIARAAPISSICFNMARFAGPALFGVIAVVASAGWAMIYNLLSYLVFQWVLFHVRTRHENLARRKGTNLAGEILEGIRYGFSHPGVGPLLIVLVASSLGTRCVVDLLPGFVSGVFGRGPEALSMMTGAIALGALTGAIYLTMRSSIVGLASVAMHATAWVGATLILFTTMHVFWIAVVNLYFLGVGLSTSAVGVLSLVQTCVRGEMRGRVLSIYGIIFRGAPALGGLAIGSIAEWTGLRVPVAGGAVICLLAWLWVLSRLPGVRSNIEQVPAPDGSTT